MVQWRSIFSRLGFYTAVTTGVFVIWLLAAPLVSAVELTYPSFSTPSEDSGEIWDVGAQAGGSIIKGVLDFDVTGLSQANIKKHQIFATYDADQPTAFGNHGYFIHFRKRAELPYDGPGFQFKLQVDCSWDDENVRTDEWLPDHSYHFTFSWDHSSTTVEVRDSATGATGVSELPLPSPLRAQDQVIVFGKAGLANNVNFPAEPGAHYDNITLDAQEVVTEYDDFGGYPACEFDGGCGCVTDGDPTSAPCSESSSQRPPVPGDEPFTTSLSGLRWQWDADTASYFEWRGNEENDQPEVEIRAMASGLPRGQKTSFTAAAQNYRTRPNNLYYSWCVRDSVTKKTANYNSVLAGGLLAETSSAEQAADHGQCCEWITRIPAIGDDQEDVNGDGQPEGDGMSDNWEREKFVGRVINGRTYNSIEEVLPGDDPDQDGVVMNRFVNEDEGVPVTVVAGLVDSLGNKYYPGGTDGQLVNAEEYILGTDPLSGDTDGDGYVDEADYLGEGQNVLEFVPELAAGTGYYEVQVSTVGLSARRKIYVAMGTQRVYPSLAGGQFKLSLSADQDLLPVGADDQTKVTLTAAPTGGEVQGAELYYRWTFQGVDICDASQYPELSKYCDFNQGQISLGGSGPLAFKDLPGMDQVAAGGDYTIGVRAADSASRQEASAEIRLKKGGALSLTTTCGGAPPEPTAALTVCVGDYGLASLDIAQSAFEWSKDGMADQAQSGMGHDQYALSATKAAGSSHHIALKVSYGDSLENELVGSIDIPVTGAAVLINQPAERIEEGDPTVPGATRFIRVMPGETITIGAQALGFGAATEYRWSWIGGETANDTSTASPESSFTYTVASEAEPGTVIPVSATARGRNETDEVMDAGDAIALLVGASAGSAGAGGGWGRLLAALETVVPPQYRTSFQLMAMVAGMGGVLAGGWYLYGRVISKR